MKYLTIREQLINGMKRQGKIFSKNLDCLAKLFSLVQCKLVKKSKLMHAKCKQLFHSSTFRILHWNFEPPLLILDTEKWGRTRVWKPKRIGVGRVKGGIKRETRAGPEMGVLKEWELGEISRNHATMLNILQLKKSWREAKKNRLGGRKPTYRSWEVWATCPSQKR